MGGGGEKKRSRDFMARGRGLAASGGWRRAWAQRVGATPWALLDRLAQTAAGLQGAGVFGRGLGAGSRCASGQPSLAAWRAEAKARGAGDRMGALQEPLLAHDREVRGRREKGKGRIEGWRRRLPGRRVRRLGA
jgi:hypothetical protein